MITENQVRQLAEEKLAGTPNYVVDVVVAPGNKIAVFLDSDDKIVITDCVAVRRHIDKSFDREVEDFSLDVSSAGTDRPLKMVRQYKKRVGREVEVTTNAGEKITGKMIAVNDTGIEVEEIKKEKVNGKKTQIINNISLTYSEIKETKVLISFK